jgi:putative transposase
LNDAGEHCGRHRVYRLMKAQGIQAHIARKQKRSRDARHMEGFEANKLNRRFYAVAPNQRWVTDITTIPTRSGYLQLAAVLDLYSRALIGWAMDTSMTTRLVKDALTMALWRRGEPREVLVHSDQGSQYRSMDYQLLLKEFDLECSMSRKGNCHDNAVMESFFHTLKSELTNRHRYKNAEEAKLSIFEYIEVFYNNKRRHSYLNYKAPFEYERLMASGE